MTEDVLTEFEPLITEAEHRDREARSDGSGWSPWARTGSGSLRYQPNVQLLVALLSGPIGDGASTQSGRLAKGFDAWIAYELRRADFDPSEVWPRNKAPRVSSKEIDAVAARVDDLVDVVERLDELADLDAQRAERAGDPSAVADAERRLEKAHRSLEKSYARRQASHARKVEKAKADGKDEPDPLPPLLLPERVPVAHSLPSGLRNAIGRVAKAMPRVNGTNVLGRFYVKQVDVVVASWDRGPDVLVSGKTMFSSFANNAKNRYEETLGEATNLRDRYPLAGMGYAFIVSDEILDESGSYARLQDLLLRTRKPHGPYDATMLLIAKWDEANKSLELFDPMTHPDPRVSGQTPSVDLSAATFFTDLLNTVIVNTPVGIHQEVRELRNGTPAPGGAPDLNADADRIADAED